MPGRTHFLVLFVLGLFATLPLAPVLAGDRPVKPRVPVVLEPTAAQLKTIQEALDKAGKDDDDELLARCLIDMEKLKHDDFVPAIKAGLKSKDDFVKAAAIRAAATHGMKDAAKDIAKLLKGKKKKKAKDDEAAAMEVLVAAIQYLARMEIKGHGKVVYEEVFEPLYRKESGLQSRLSKARVEACCHYLGVDKYKGCVEKLIELLPEPRATDPNSASNPPANVWEARFKLWQASEGFYRWTLKEITGKEYRSVREWKAWWSKYEKEYSK